MVPLWVSDALDEGEEFGQEEEEGEAADIDMEVANEDGKLVDVLGCKKKTWIQQVKTRAETK